MAFCLPKFAADTFKSKLKSGEINPGMLAGMTSKERNQFFSGFLSKEQAASTNALFESKTLLKNQQQGMINWAKTVSGIKEPARRELIDRINKLDKVLTPEEESAFLADLAAQRLGVGVSAQEAEKIAGLAKKVNEAKNAMEAGGDRMAYGKARVELANYANGLKEESTKKTLGELATQNPLTTVSQVGGQAKSIKASLDNSAIFRQGWKTLWTNPNIWQKNARKTFSDLVKTFGGKNVMDELYADIYSRPTYDQMRKAKLAIGNIEEAFPSALPEKIPVLGRAYKASEAAYTGFVQKTRADVFDRYLDIAEKSGVDISDKKELEAIGKLVNSLTGRGHLAGAEPAADFFNNVFFSPRFLKSNIDMLTLHGLDKDITPFARKQAAYNLVKVVSGTAAVLAIANAVKPGSVEWDPRSADFGKIKVGNTRFDVSGGMASILTLAARQATNSSKKTTTGKVVPYGPKLGQTNRFDAVVDFFSNKLSPIGSVLRDWGKGEDFDGNKPTIASSAKNLLVPLPISNYEKLRDDPKSANDLAAVIADALGIGANNYSPRK